MHTLSASGGGCSIDCWSANLTALVEDVCELFEERKRCGKGAAEKISSLVDVASGADPNMKGEEG